MAVLSLMKHKFELASELLSTQMLSRGLHVSSSIQKFVTSIKERVLITGGMGQLGRALAASLRAKHGDDNVILSDIVKPTDDVLAAGPFVYADILDAKSLHQIVVNNRITSLVHFSALLSAIGERNVPLAMQVNVGGVQNILEVSRAHKLKVFIPSTIGAFGPDTPKNPTPDLTIQRPTTIYGVAKVYAELLGEYYSTRYGVDFRSLRYPGVLSAETMPGGGTTDYAISIFHDALKRNYHNCYLRADTRMPMIYIDDCIRATVEILAVPESALQRRVYNISAVSFTPSEIAAQIQTLFPKFKIEYTPDARQIIADSWPQVLCDKNARQDWSWKHEYDLKAIVAIMFEKLIPRYSENEPFVEAIDRN